MAATARSFENGDLIGTLSRAPAFGTDGTKAANTGALGDRCVYRKEKLGRWGRLPEFR